MLAASVASHTCTQSDHRQRACAMSGLPTSEICFDARLQIPFSMSLNGTSGCGKSFFIKTLLLNQGALLTQKWHKIFYVSRYKLAGLERDLAHLPIEFLQGEIPSLLQLRARQVPGQQTCLVVDDMIESAAKNCDIKSLFTEGRHIGYSIILSSQNLFQAGKYARPIRLNSTYVVLFKAAHDKRQIACFFQGMEPVNKKWKRLLEIYEDAVSAKPYGYLFIDYRSAEKLRYRADIKTLSHVIYRVL